MAALFALDMVIFSQPDQSGREVYGYLSILISLSFVFFGIRAYRNIECQGSITFFKALGIGVLITLLPAILFGVYNVIYMEVIEPDFADQYFQAAVEQIKLDYSGAELDAKLEEMSANKALFMSPVFNFFLMSITVFLIGVVVSVISAVTLKKA